MTRSSARDLAVGFVFSLLFLLLLLIHGPVNLEQYHHSQPGSLIFFSNLLEGRITFWYEGFGLGTPLPLGENLLFHPLFLLTPLLPLRLIFSVFWLLHLTLGAFYFLRLCRRLEIAPAVGRCLVFCFVFSVATVNYSYLNDWPSVFLTWTSLPVLLFYLDGFIESGARAAPWSKVAGLTLLFGFSILNSHPGYFFVPGLVFLVFALVRSRLKPRVITWLCLTALMIVCLIAEKTYFIASESLHFPADQQRVQQSPYSVEAWLRALYLPFTSELVDSIFDFDGKRSLTAYLDCCGNLRVPFLGLVVLFTAFVTSILTLLPRRRGTPTGASGFPQALSASFLFSFAVSLIPTRYSFGISSGVWLFRDPAILFGLLIAGRGLSLWLATKEGWKRGWLRVILTLQYFQVILGLLPGLLTVYRDREVNTQFYHGRHEKAFAQWLEEKTDGLGSRLYLSPRMTNALLSERAVYAALGLLGTGDFSRMGLEPVNGYFKGVSMDALHPSLFLMMGVIASDPAVIKNEVLFDVLGIDFLLIQPREITAAFAGDLDHLKILGRFSVPELAPLVLMHNPNAWPRTVLYPPSIENIALKQLDCPNQALLLCRDFSALQQLRLAESLNIERFNDLVLLTLEHSDRDRIAMVSTLFRPEWRALDGQGRELRTLPIAQTLLGVEIPAGTAEVSVRYDPRWRRRLLLLEVVTALVCLGLLARRPRPS